MLLLKVEEKTIELCSNEWKSQEAKHMKVRQQSKNIRSNCSILNQLHFLRGGTIKEIMELVMTGKAI